jgi:hypothetical protein
MIGHSNLGFWALQLPKRNDQVTYGSAVAQNVHMQVALYQSRYWRERQKSIYIIP